MLITNDLFDYNQNLREICSSNNKFNGGASYGIFVCQQFITKTFIDLSTMVQP